MLSLSCCPLQKGRAAGSRLEEVWSTSTIEQHNANVSRVLSCKGFPTVHMILRRNGSALDTSKQLSYQMLNVYALYIAYSKNTVTSACQY